MLRRGGGWPAGENEKEFIMRESREFSSLVRYCECLQSLPDVLKLINSVGRMRKDMNRDSGLCGLSRIRNNSCKTEYNNKHRH